MSTITIERREQIAFLTIERPPLNILDIATLDQLTAALNELRDETALRALVIQGGGRCFSAGVDIADHTVERVPAMLESVAATIKALYRFPLPTVALLHGHVLGGGLELALACDIVVARAGAQLGLPEIKLGVFAPYAAVLLPALVGRQQALYLLATGDSIDVQRAHQLGLIQQIIAEDAELERLLAGLAAQSTTALRLTKRAVLDTLGDQLDQALETVHRLYLDDLMHSHDMHEGLAAFTARRAPQWNP